jgi:lipopolysaccharide heptosyltransferase I
MASRILIVRLGSLGDLVHTLPAASALRRANPTAQIDWLVDRPHREFLELVPVISSLVVLERRGAGGWLDAMKTMRSRGYDLAIDFQGLVKSAALARLSGARKVAGFGRAALRERFASAFYTEHVDIPVGSHVVRKNLVMAAALGAPAGGGALEFPIGEVRSPAVESFVAADSRPFALINPGAAWPNKRWPPVRLGAVARHLLDRHNIPSVVLWGPGEQVAADAVVQASSGAARVAPPTGLKDLIALARHARLIVSGDTGPLHIACAVGVPAVALFGPTDPLRNGPWDPRDISISLYDTCDCHYRRQCRRDSAEWCLGKVTVDQVVQAIDRRLRS